MKFTTYGAGRSMLVCTGTSKFFSHFLLVLLLIGSAYGCRKIVEEQGLIDVCPTVASTDAANGATNVATRKPLTATFSEEMDPASINATTFLLRQGSTPVSGTVTYSGRSATFTPTNPLEADMAYSATITQGTKDPTGNAMIADYIWSFNTGSIPVVVSTDPANGAINVMLDKVITATFSTVMNSSTINEATFLVKQAGVNIPGVVRYTGMTASFTPASPLSTTAVYTAIITSGAKDTAGNTMKGNHTWSFATAAVPSIVSTDPANTATGVALNKRITASFSEAMDGSTINDLTYFVKHGNTEVPGTVSYSGTIASFRPDGNLLPGTLYTATITRGAKNPAGIALAADYVWSFTTTGETVPPTSFLGSAAMFGVFGGDAGVTNQGLNTVINNGSVGTTAASTLITGLHDGTGASYTETPLNVGLVTGRIYTAPPMPGTGPSFAIATQGALDANAAYLAISPASRPGGTDPGAGELGGLTLAPGVYKSASGTFKITNGHLTLDAMGDPNAAWIFQTAAGLTVGIAGPTGARSVNMINGAQPKNVYWYVGSAATINAAGGGTMTGTIIASAGVTFSTAGNAAQTVLNGRALSLHASVTLVNTTINVPD